MLQGFYSPGACIIISQDVWQVQQTIISPLDSLLFFFSFFDKLIASPMLSRLYFPLVSSSEVQWLCNELLYYWLWHGDSPWHRRSISFQAGYCKTRNRASLTSPVFVITCGITWLRLPSKDRFLNCLCNVETLLELLLYPLFFLLFLFKQVKPNLYCICLIMIGINSQHLHMCICICACVYACAVIYSKWF